MNGDYTQYDINYAYQRGIVDATELLLKSILQSMIVQAQQADNKTVADIIESVFAKHVIPMSDLFHKGGYI